MAGTCQRIIKRRTQRHYLVIAPDEPRRRQQPQRKIPRADARRSRRRHAGLAKLRKVVDHAVGRLVAIVGLLFQQMHDDRRQHLGHRCIDLARGCRHPRQVIMRKPQRIARTERRLTGGQLVQCRAQRIQIGALIHRPTGTPRLLGRQIRQRAHNLAVVAELRTNLSYQRRQAETHQARRAVRRNHNVRRADITMQHTTAMHARDRLGHARRQVDQVVERKGLDHLRQARLPGIRKHDRGGVMRRIQHLRHTHHAPQPLQDSHLVLQSTLRRPDPAALCG